MERTLPDDSSEDEETVLELRALKKIRILKQFSHKTRNIFNELIDGLICEEVFQTHMELSLGVTNSYPYISNVPTPDSLLHMSEHLNINKVNQDVDCPKCFMLVKCLWLSKHLAGCMNPHQSTYSYSSRNSSRIARQRIQEGFKTSYEDAKNDSEDEKMKPKKRNKGRKAKIKVVKAPVK